MNINNEAQMDLKALDILKDLFISILDESTSLDLSGFKGIKIISDSSLHSDSDGNLKDKTMLLPKNKTQQYLYNGDYDIIKATIYHELCHVDLSNKLPHLHDLHSRFEKEENYIKCFTIMIYIEYIAHLESLKLETDKTQKVFYESVNKRKWDFKDECDKIMFIKVAPYIIGRDKDNKYICNITNDELRKRIIVVKTELEKLPNIASIDNYNILKDLEILVSEYVSNY